MFNSRLFRIFVCAVVICCMIFNYAAIPAKATAVGTIALGTVSGAAAAGIAATLFAVAMGVVVVGLTYELIVDIGENLRQSGVDFYQNDTDKQTQWTTWIDGLEYDLGGGGDGTGSSGGDPYNDPFLNLAGNTLVYDVLQNWGAKLMNGEGIETEGESASDGYSYYNGMLLPEIPNSPAWNYSAIVQYLCDGSICCYNIPFSDSISLGCVSDSSKYYFSFYGPSIYYYCYKLVDGRWKLSQSGNRQTSMPLINWDLSGMDSYYSSLVWCSLDCFFGDELLMSSTDPVSTQTVIVEPSIYVGDIPQKIQNGEADEDDIVIPDIDYSKIFEGQTDAVSALDQVSTQLADGTMTYDQYLEMTTPQTGTGSDTNTGTDVWNPPESPVGFALDLSNYFPFCIPFDLYDFFSCLNADPVAPVIQWELPLPGGSTYPIEIDLSPFDSVAQLLRRLQLLLFIVGLAVKTRDLIKG